MSKSKAKGEKIQIVAFSTNENEYNPNDLINIYLENNNHLIIKKTTLATAFTTTLQKNSKQTKIMVCSVLNLSKEYTGINDVNCYMLFIDLEKEDSKSKLEIILNYAKENCNLEKKMFVFGIVTQKENRQYITKEEIQNDIDEAQIIYEYKEIYIKENKDICNNLENVFIYGLSNPIKKGNKNDDKDGEQSGSCNIF
jgi:hypothetical protein